MDNEFLYVSCCESESHTDSDSNGNAERYPDTDANSYSERYAYPDSYCNTLAYSDGNADTKRDSISYASVRSGC